MQLFHYLCFLTLLVLSPVVAAAAHNADSGYPPSTLSELRDALQELGYEGVDGLPNPQPSKLPYADNKGCVNTVSILAYFSRP